MTTLIKHAPGLITIAACVMLTACVAPSTPPTDTAYYGGTGPAQGAPGNVVAGPLYYRGTESGIAAVGNDAAINANVIQALSRISGAGATNLQVTTANGVVTLRGTADSQLIAQNNVQAARQVPGVQRVDYDIQVRAGQQ